FGGSYADHREARRGIGARQGVMKAVGLLVGSTLLLWACVIFPARLLWGDAVWAHSLAALALCLVPALATLAWTPGTRKIPEKHLVAILGSSGIRMAFALGGGISLYKAIPELFTDAFWLWMALFYMFILAVETILLVKKKTS